MEIGEESGSGGVKVFSVTGELDLYTAPKLKARLQGAIDSGERSVVLDLTGTTFVDSTALGVLIATVKALEPVGGQLVLANTQASIAKTLAITGLDRALAVEGSREDAVARAHTP